MFTAEQFRQKYGRLSYVYHMTSIKNLHSIFAAGEVRSFSLMQGITYEHIDNEEVQIGRAQISVPGGKLLHDYVPLYFTYKTPMSAFNSAQNQEWVYLTFEFAKMASELSDIVITDGNARSTGTVFKVLTALSDFDVIDWHGAMRDTKWTLPGKPLDRKRKRQAEMLVPDRLPLKYLVSISAVDETVRSQVQSIARPFLPNLAVTKNEGWFFL